MTYSHSKIRHVIVFSLPNQQSATHEWGTCLFTFACSCTINMLTSSCSGGENQCVSSDVIWHSACTMTALPETSSDRESCIFHTLCHLWEHSSNLTNQPHIWQDMGSDRTSYRVIWFIFLLIPVICPNMCMLSCICCARLHTEKEQ